MNHDGLIQQLIASFPNAPSDDIVRQTADALDHMDAQETENFINSIGRSLEEERSVNDVDAFLNPFYRRVYSGGESTPRWRTLAEVKAAIKQRPLTHNCRRGTKCDFYQKPLACR